MSAVAIAMSRSQALALRALIGQVEDVNTMHVRAAFGAYGPIEVELFSPTQHLRLEVLHNGSCQTLYAKGPNPGAELVA